ncbi:MAG TPA: hypothetical protein VMF29_01695, partial [Candidatus Edwardsbacteria bacterium]|nr:hypothetical protein [Candidatus Edwardsbacteria bacterium]
MKRSFALLGIALLAFGTATAYAGNVVEGFEGTDFPPGGWSLSGSASLWLRSTSCSGYGVGSASALADFYNVSSGSQNLITLTFYPSVAGDTVRFAFAYAPYSSSYRDSLVISSSTNGGTSWTQLGALSWADSTAKGTTSQFVPTSSQWATKKYALPVGSNKVRFTGISKYGNEMYVDSVRISGQNAPHDVGVSTVV